MARKMRLAPIAKLPVELLSYIFLLGAHTPDPDRLSEDECDADQENSDAISPCLQSSGTSPDVLAAVNRHWREVAIGTPQLWTRICVTIGDVMRGGALFSVVSRYVSRSGKCPLDIFIDGRDPDWDFSETDSVGAVISPYIDELYDYTHPFKVEHMHHVLNILIPHVRRFRSLAVLTDRWAPMQTALDCLSMEIPAFVSAPRPLPSSLPLLESLVLMRCNEFVSYHGEFSPADRKDSGFLPFSALLREADDPASEPVLPGLKKLVLSGVHTDWSALPRLLPAPQSARPSPLETLDMSYHCTEVRPSARDFHALLARCPMLRTLSLRVSGPRAPDSADTRSTAPIPLPLLEQVTFGYDDAHAAAAVLDALDAPAVAHLTLEDAACPAREDRLDAAPLLRACTTRSGKGGPPFPRIAALALHRVDAPAEAFEALYGALPALRVLAVSQMFVLGARALRPDVEMSFEPALLQLPAGAPVEAIEADGERVASKLADVDVDGCAWPRQLQLHELEGAGREVDPAQRALGVPAANLGAPKMMWG